MSSSADPDVPRLVNPYARAVDGRPAVWGVTLGRAGLAAAGVLAVAVPAADAAAAATPGSGAAAAAELRLDGSAEVVLGPSGEVDVEVQALCMPSGYLYAAEPGDDAPVSPALA